VRRRVFLRRTFILLLPVGFFFGALLVPDHFLAPALPGTTIYLPPETTIPDTTVPATTLPATTLPPTTVPDCVYVVVRTTEPPPTSALVCPWPP
jgi:hypothetical protein